MSLTRDLQYSLRMWTRNAGVTVASLICLSLGIGATTAIFTVLHAVVLKPLPYQEPERLIRVYTEFPTFPNGGLRRFWTSAPEFLELRRDSTSWDSLEAWIAGGVNISGTEDPIRVTAANVSGGLLNSLGVAPAFGRLLTPEDDINGAPATAVLGHGLWQRLFGGGDVLGREIRINGRPCTIVGVMPPGFEFPPGETDAPELWTPLQLDPANPGNRGGHYLYMLGRLKQGVSYPQARMEMSQLVQKAGESGSHDVHNLHPEFHPLISSPLHEEVVAGVRPALVMLMAAVGFVLLIACVNVANLLLARAEARRHEIAVRMAMGAGARILWRQFLVEGLVLALAGAAGGLLLAFGGLKLIQLVGPEGLPRLREIQLDGGVLLFTLAISLATGLFFGLAPLTQAFTRSLIDSLRPTAGRTTLSMGAVRYTRVLVVAEMALALVLLIGAGLMLQAFWKLQRVDIGLKPDRLLTLRVSLPSGVYPESERVERFWSDVQQRVSALPGVESFTMMSGLPPSRRLDANDTQVENFVDRPGGPRQNVDFYQTVGNRYFETMGIPFVEGRFFDERDGAGAPESLIVNQALARTFFPGESALGRRMKPGFSGPWRTIVGVVGNAKNGGIDRDPLPELYFPFAQTQGRGLRNAILVARTSGDPMSLVPAVRSELARLDPSLPLSAIQSMDDVLYSSRARPRFLTLLLSLFTGVAIALAAVGIYGVMSYAVARRTNEFGIRIAMGAGSGDVLRIVLRQGMFLGGLGAVLGTGAAFALTRYMSGLLFGIEAFDAGTFALMAGLLLGVTLMACYLPALRATRVDPLVALRYE